MMYTKKTEMANGLNGLVGNSRIIYGGNTDLCTNMYTFMYLHMMRHLQVRN